MNKIPIPYAGMGADVLSNNEKIIAKLKADSVSHYGFKAQDGKFIPFLTPQQLAEQIGVSVKTLERMRKRGGGPPFLKICTKQIRYPIVGLTTWADSLMQQQEAPKD